MDMNLGTIVSANFIYNNYIEKFMIYLFYLEQLCLFSFQLWRFIWFWI